LPDPPVTNSLVVSPSGVQSENISNVPYDQGFHPLLNGPSHHGFGGLVLRLG
jgi:hypothetical protein